VPTIVRRGRGDTGPFEAAGAGRAV
jgi:hypothetical protein